MKVERTAAGIVFGKLQYLSPEQARGEPLDHRSDLYSLAILATELLAGAPYYQGVPRERLSGPKTDRARLFLSQILGH